MAFPQQFLDEIRARVPLTQLVGRRVALKQRGRDDWWGLSPFTTEKSPSFHVRDDKGYFHCFSTGEHGDHFSWLMQVEGQSFPEAVEILAGMAGMEVPKSSPEERQREERRKELIDVVQFAVGWFEAQLRTPKGREAMSYLQARGLEPMTIEAFHLGFAPDDKSALAEAANEDGIEMPQLIEAGLYRAPDDGRPPYPLFRDRIMFPIEDRRGRPIAFGGRFMGDAKAVGVGKYINSPDTPLFDKSRTLFNLHRAREPGREGERLIAVEGYMDVIALWQKGFPFAVAPLGTAVTEHQIAEMWRLVDEPILCLDGDIAGQRAASRAAERALPGLKPGKSLRFAFMPDGEDPDSLVNAPDGVREMGTRLDNADSLSAFLFDTETLDVPLDTPERRAKLERDLFFLASKIEDEGVKRAYQAEFKDRLWTLFRKRRDARFQATRRTAIRTFRKERDAARGPSAAQPYGREKLQETTRRLVRRQQEIVLAILLSHPTLLPDVDERLDALVFDPDLDKLRGALQKLSLSGETLDPEALRHHLIASGVEGPLSVVTRTELFQLAPQARPGSDIVAARTVLDHILLIRQQAALVGEYRTAAREIGASPMAGGPDTSAPEALSEAADRGVSKTERDAEKRLNALRRSVEDGESRIGSDLGEFGEEY